MPPPIRTVEPPARSTGGSGRALARAFRLVGALLIGLAVVLSGSSPAGAHADLTSTSPVSGSVLAEGEAPAEVVLTFTENVAVETDGVRILDSDGDRRDAGTASASGSVVSVPVEGTLGQGGYVVAWRVVSADGHPINGAFQFSVGIRSQVGADVVDSAFGSGSDQRDRQFGSVLRAVAYACTMVAAGVTVVGARLRRSGDPSPVTWWVALLAAVGVLALVLQVPVQTSLMTGRGWGSVTETGVLGRALGDGLGWALGISVLGLVLIGITAGLPFKGPVPIIAIAGGVMAPVGFVLFGHTNTMSPALVAYVADLAHVWAAAVWFGGLVALLVILRRRRAEGEVVAAGSAVGSFSAIAGVALAVVAASGLAMGWIEVGGLDALTGTTYGKYLMLKVALVGLVALGGTWNRFRLVPHLVAGGAVDGGGQGPAVEADADVEEVDEVDEVDSWAPDGQTSRWESLGRVLRIEVALLVAVVGITGVLVNETPARQALQTVPRVEAPFGEGTMEVWLSPGRAGLNDVHVILLGDDGAPDDTFQEAELALSLPASDVGPIELEPVRVGPGHFQAVAVDLSIKGDWTLTVRTRPDRFTLTEGTSSFRIG
ncbi:MAG: copper resistance protein CopC/CopD [Acidimicrobiales bacterium]|nr:copper resistance protein CopC/CopD [Acidimicrobiales bacterium]